MEEKFIKFVQENIEEIISAEEVKIIRSPQYGSPRVMEIRSWRDLANIE